MHLNLHRLFQWAEKFFQNIRNCKKKISSHIALSAAWEANSILHEKSCCVNHWIMPSISLTVAFARANLQRSIFISLHCCINATFNDKYVEASIKSAPPLIQRWSIKSPSRCRTLYNSSMQRNATVLWFSENT